MTTPVTVGNPERRGVRLRWYREVGLVIVFYIVYSFCRNLFGSATVPPSEAFANAMRVIDIEEAIGLYVEPAVQKVFLDFDLFLRAWNIFYGTFHFVVTAGIMVWLYRRYPARYPTWRDTLAFTTALALIGFSLFPLMPPRLLGEFSQFGGHSLSFHFVDTLKEHGGLWSFESGAVGNVSNQYAAMPSLHFGWSLWCYFALGPVVRRRWTFWLLAIYPWATLFAIVVTANHYWLDAAGGALVLAAGYVLGSRLARYFERRAERRAVATDDERVGADGSRGRDEVAGTAGGHPDDTADTPADAPRGNDEHDQSDDDVAHPDAARDPTQRRAPAT